LRSPWRPTRRARHGSPRSRLLRQSRIPGNARLRGAQAAPCGLWGCLRRSTCPLQASTKTLREAHFYSDSRELRLMRTRMAARPSSSPVLPRRLPEPFPALTRARPCALLRPACSRHDRRALRRAQGRDSPQRPHVRKRTRPHSQRSPPTRLLMRCAVRGGNPGDPARLGREPELFWAKGRPSSEKPLLFRRYGVAMIAGRRPVPGGACPWRGGRAPGSGTGTPASRPNAARSPAQSCPLDMPLGAPGERGARARRLTAAAPRAARQIGAPAGRAAACRTPALT